MTTIVTPSVIATAMLLFLISAISLSRLVMRMNRFIAAQMLPIADSAAMMKNPSRKARKYSSVAMNIPVKRIPCSVEMIGRVASLMMIADERIIDAIRMPTETFRDRSSWISSTVQLSPENTRNAPYDVMSASARDKKMWTTPEIRSTS